MSWKYIATAFNAWKYVATAFNAWKYIAAVYNPSLPDYISQMAFWSSTFNFTTNVLTDKSGNANHVPMIGGYCVNFINDVTITLNPVQIGATITELNKSSVDLNGISINGSGNIEITQASLTDPKVYHFKLSTGDDFYLTGGDEKWVFSKLVLFGTLGGAVDTDWEQETQDNYFANQQRGFTLGGDLPLNISYNMTTWGKRNFATPDATTVQYTGINSVAFNSFFELQNLFESGGHYKAKITTWDSTENFGAGSDGLKVLYASASGVWLDDDGDLISNNGEHIMTFDDPWPGALNRITFDITDATIDMTGKNLKFRVERIRKIESVVLVPAYDSSLDAVGESLGVSGSSAYLNGSETELDFSGITGVTEAGGGAFSPPATYTLGDAVTNPMVKRVRYSSSFEELENDYIIFKSFINGNTLTDILYLLEEANMLIKRFSNVESNQLLVLQKYDSTRDVLTIFGKVGPNELYTYSQQSLVNNSKQLPVAITYAGNYNDWVDRIGPYNMENIGWVGGGHNAPSVETIQSDWEEILAFNDTTDTVTVGDATEFPEPPSGGKRLVEIKNWDGVDYAAGARVKYGVSGEVLSLSVILSGNVDLSGVVLGGGNPSQVNYTFQSGSEDSKIIANDPTDWLAVNDVSITVVNSLKDYTQIDKGALTGGDIMRETVRYTMSQKSPTVSIVYQNVMLEDYQIIAYYGMQGTMIASGGDARMYLAHSDDETMRAVSGVTSGARATYLCEKVVSVSDYTDNSASTNKSDFMDLSYGTPSDDESTNPYWNTTAKNYFQNIHNQAKVVGDLVTWRGGFNMFKNQASTQYVLAYYQYENDELYFIVDFTGNLTFGSINEVFDVVGGRKCEVIYKDDGIAITDDPDTSFTIPDTGLDLTATSVGNIKIKLL